MRRRGLLARGIVATGVLAGGVLPYGISRLLAPAAQAAPPHRRLRLPGALADEAAFTAACIGCGLCGEVCPPRCIAFRKREGGDGVNMPYIDPQEKACTLCGKCMQVCPTAALSVIPREQIDMGVARIDRAACYPWVDQGVCGACVSICQCTRQQRHRFRICRDLSPGGEGRVRGLRPVRGSLPAPQFAHSCRGAVRGDGGATPGLRRRMQFLHNPGRGYGEVLPRHAVYTSL